MVSTSENVFFWYVVSYVLAPTGPASAPIWLMRKNLTSSGAVEPIARNFCVVASCGRVASATSMSMLLCRRRESKRREIRWRVVGQMHRGSARATEDGNRGRRLTSFYLESSNAPHWNSQCETTGNLELGCLQRTVMSDEKGWSCMLLSRLRYAL